MKRATISNRKATKVKHIQNWQQKLFGFLALCLLIVIGISACDTETNTTPQICNGVVNVNSCTSSNSDIQNTVIAGWQLNNAQAQATTQASLNATVTAQATVQNATTKDESIISVGNIIIPLAFFISIIAFFASFGEDQESITVKVFSGIIMILLLIMIITIW
jgi:hypothetical protein